MRLRRRPNATQAMARNTFYSDVTVHIRKIWSIKDQRIITVFLSYHLMRLNLKNGVYNLSKLETKLELDYF